MANFKIEDLSQYNKAVSLWFDVSSNGKLDIGKGPDDEDKISLSSKGVVRLFVEWLKEYSHLNEEEKRKILSSLKKTKR
ncbi:hypothetical protein HMI01_15250 [Halolactibacillus miurensis]|uniref:Uncharacterized protein n=1 Tax=Halolactibacillus miurensis TaxID=306541 RepID=A0A1I6RYV2_9BACI|nr:hypothetical protein [Halolactibacillus miurensis]GEM04537.1 hypothetical protein HMI01_15250 [Halolactibacillus miurensis]SFS69867.1 hypothetical protein SAMN05421668_10738 [Halolactibacillus miurensis]